MKEIFRVKRFNEFSGSQRAIKVVEKVKIFVYWSTHGHLPREIKSFDKHLNEVAKYGKNAGRLDRPYMRSPSTITNIIKSGRGVPDATFKGGFNYRVPGTFRGSQGIFELGINPKTNTIYHFNFIK